MADEKETSTELGTNEEQAETETANASEETAEQPTEENTEKPTLNLEKKLYYFCAVNVQTGNNVGLQTYIVTDDKQHKLTKEQLLANKAYEEFANKKEVKKKNKYIGYETFETETEVTNATTDSTFDSLIMDKKAVSIATGNLDITETSDKADKKKAKAKRKKESKTSGQTSPWKTIAIAVSCLLLGAGGIVLAGHDRLFPKPDKYKNQTIVAEDGTAYENGMIIPVQNEVSEYSKKITVSIDQSYLSVPTEDIQIKAEVKDGKAIITLPEFDRTDFFTHVEGYTWGFTSKPDGTRIQYESGKTYAFTEDTKLYRVLVKYGGGSGTKEEPYIINYYDQLELMAKDKAKGYFIQTENIEFPTYAKHKSIDTVNELKDKDEYFEYDGNGYTISNISDSLFGTVSGAMIKNVNIINSRISTQDYDDIGFIVKKAINYAHNDKTTGDTIIKHCSVQHSAIVPEYYNSEEITTETTTEHVEVIEPEQIEYDEDGNIIEKEVVEVEEITKKSAEHCIGAITGLGGKIEDCYVNDFGIYSYFREYFLYVGAVSGRPTSVTDTYVNYVTINGKFFNCGGIVGSASGSRLYDLTGKELPTYFGGNVQGCVVKNTSLSAEISCGGIAGEGTSNSESAIISNCYVKNVDLLSGIFNEKNEITEHGAYGGIIGADGHEKYGHIVTNCVSMADTKIIGSKVLSKYDDTVRQAPEYAYYQENILTVLNKNSIDKKNNVFTGTFKFNDTVGDNGGLLAFPTDIEDLFNIGN